MISDQINHLIDQVKQHPNSESRNSLLGRLKDAKAHAFMLEREEFMQGPYDPIKEVGKQFLSLGKPYPSAHEQTSRANCICPAPGVRDKSCLAPIHK